MNKEQSPLFYGITEIHCGLLLAVLAVVMFVNPSFAFSGNLLLSFSVAAVFIAVLSFLLVSGYNKTMLGRAQLKTLGKAKYVILVLNVIGFLIVGLIFLIPSRTVIYGGLNFTMLYMVLFFAFEIISLQYYKKKLPSYKPELV
jgi:hypothetical protein